MKGLVGLAIAGVAVYGFMNGWGAAFGICPPGYTVAGGECTNSFVGVTPAAGSPAAPTTAHFRALQIIWPVRF